MSGFTKNCIYCNQEIRLSNDSGRWLPYNLDNTAHECKNTKSSQSQTQQQPEKEVQEHKSNLTLEDLDLKLKGINERLKRIEATLYGGS